MSTTTDLRTVVVADRGPVADAVVILAERTTLAEHVTLTRDDWTATVEHSGDIPFELWGSGTQALWRLLCSIAYSADTVSLYDALSRLDRRNTLAVADAFAALCEAAR